MKLIFLAALVAACTASALFQQRNVIVNGDGIQIWTPYRQVSIVPNPNGQSSIQVTVNGPQIPASNLYFSGYPYGQQQTPVVGSSETVTNAPNAQPQFAILQEIFSQYQGAVNDSLYQQLLTRVQNAVQQGQINPQVYYFLANFQSGNYYGQGLNYGPFAQRYGYGSSSNVPSGLSYLLQSVFGNQYQGQYPSQYYQGQQYQGQYQYPSQYQGQYPSVLSSLLSGNYQIPQYNNYYQSSPSVSSSLLSGQYFQSQYPYSSQYYGYGNGQYSGYPGYQGLSGNQGVQGFYGQGYQGQYGQGYQGQYGQGYQGQYGQGYQGQYGQGYQGQYGQGYQGQYYGQGFQGLQGQIAQQQPVAVY